MNKHTAVNSHTLEQHVAAITAATFCLLMLKHVSSVM